ncbi:3-oxoacyl-[acyl-carrier protein] reductase [Enhygromyxa salina]|uniref:3-oxoacyl-[acyl-carrier protein] reductase n=1 Tax=Enhygromyxa salina TaxID=215803 RepID=A0A0C2D3J7_9BACT|nr:3-oxoacyl-ACP reductase [Enhygromyxa salina]KIG16305.1 3-oxoacyl-[acyl-carrier protein] reductase [Enhygromyxa salina]
MNDILLQLGKNPQARRLVKTLGLPLPIPQALARAKGPMEERPLHDYEIAVGGYAGAGESALIEVLAKTLTQAGATPLVVGDAHIPPAFLAHGDAWGRPPRGLLLDALPDKLRLDAMVFDATQITDAAGLRSLYEFFHPLVRSLRKCGRVVLLARPPGLARSPEVAGAQAAIEGFCRSLGKELGKAGTTANVLFVEESAEPLVPGPLRFLLSKRSAFISGQPLHVSTRTLDDEGLAAFEPAFVRSLEGKVALVTGAARGIGRATAKLLADEGAHVVCLDRPADDELLSAIALEIGGTPLLADVSDPETPALIAKTLREDHGGVDIVVHNAGITRDKTLARMSPEHWDQVFSINLNAIARITDALIADDGPLLDDGRVIVLSSIAGVAGNLGQTNYAATKAGVIGYVRRLADELDGRGVTVNAIAPGFIETRLTAAIPVMIREVGRRLSSLGQGGLPRDIGDAITFLATPGSQGLTGNVLRVCGQSFVGS